MAETEPQTNGVENGLEAEDERGKLRPADIDADVREMERRKRVEAMMNSRLFREELERIIELQMKDGSGPAGLLQQISDMMGIQTGRIQLRSGSCVSPINDIRGVESMGYAKGEKNSRCKLACVFRLMDLYGWAQGIHNIITVRLTQDEEHFLVNPYGMLFNEITASSLAKVDMQGNVIEGGTTNLHVNVPSYLLHSVIHANRPDLKCLIHVHTSSVLAVSSLKCGLLPLCEEACVIGEVSQHPFIQPGFEPEEREKIIRNLGPTNKVLLLNNHGAVCGGSTVEEAFFNVYNTVVACETQVKLLPAGIDNLMLIEDETRKRIYDAAHRTPQADPTEKRAKPVRVGELEFEALIRMLDNAGFRTGYIYRHPLVKGEVPRPRNDVEVPPAVSSLGYLIEEEEMYRQGNWKKQVDGRNRLDRTRWLNSPNVYQKVEILETGTPDPKKITKWVEQNSEEWVAEASPTHSSTPVKIDAALQFVPTNTNPKEFKKLQQQLKENRRADKITSGPQSHILEGVSWEEAKKLQDANVTQTGDQVILVGAASKGIIQRNFQHNAMVYKAPYAKNPFDSVSDKEIEDYKKLVEKKQRGDTDYEESQSESEALSSSRQDASRHIKSPQSMTSETEEETRDEPRVLRIETKTAPRAIQAELVLSDAESDTTDTRIERSQSARYPQPEKPESVTIMRTFRKSWSLKRDKDKSKDDADFSGNMLQRHVARLRTLSPPKISQERKQLEEDLRVRKYKIETARMRFFIPEQKLEATLVTLPEETSPPMSPACTLISEIKDTLNDVMSPLNTASQADELNSSRASLDLGVATSLLKDVLRNLTGVTDREESKDTQSQGDNFQQALEEKIQNGGEVLEQPCKSAEFQTEEEQVEDSTFVRPAAEARPAFHELLQDKLSRLLNAVPGVLSSLSPRSVRKIPSPPIPTPIPQELQSGVVSLGSQMPCKGFAEVPEFAFSLHVSDNDSASRGQSSPDSRDPENVLVPFCSQSPCKEFADVPQSNLPVYTFDEKPDSIAIQSEIEPQFMSDELPKVPNSNVTVFERPVSDHESWLIIDEEPDNDSIGPPTEIESKFTGEQLPAVLQVNAPAVVLSVSDHESLVIGDEEPDSGEAESLSACEELFVKVVPELNCPFLPLPVSDQESGPDPDEVPSSSELDSSTLQLTTIESRPASKEFVDPTSSIDLNICDSEELATVADEAPSSSMPDSSKPQCEAPNKDFIDPASPPQPKCGSEKSVTVTSTDCDGSFSPVSAFSLIQDSPPPVSTTHSKAMIEDWLGSSKAFLPIEKLCADQSSESYQISEGEGDGPGCSSSLLPDESLELNLGSSVTDEEEFIPLPSPIAFENPNENEVQSPNSISSPPPEEVPPLNFDWVDDGDKSPLKSTPRVRRKADTFNIVVLTPTRKEIFINYPENSISSFNAFSKSPDEQGKSVLPTIAEDSEENNAKANSVVNESIGAEYVGLSTIAEEDSAMLTVLGDSA